MSKGTGKAGGVATGFGGRTSIRKADGVRYVKTDGAIRSGDVAVKVSVDKLDQAWRPSNRIPKGGGDQGPEKYANAAKYTASGKKVRMPEVHIHKDGSVTFRDGRHRAAALRDQGKKHIYVTVSRSQAKKAKRELGE
jgi:ketosteroid isomerase-like protein